MRALANAMLNHGAIVSGSDISPGGCLQMLERQGVRCWSGHDASQLTEPVDFAVASAAINENNPELVRLRQDGVKIYKYAQMLGMLMDKHTGVAISGTHGKSTTSAMTAYVLRRAGLDPSFVVGANVDQLSGASGVGRGEFFVAEACEFDRSFLNLRPTLAAILNVEEDHLDCYGDINQIISAFEAFAGQVRPGGLLIVNGEDDNIAKFVHRLRIPVETFGLDKACCWRADDLVMIDGCYAFDLLYRDKVLGRCKLEIPGRHNVLNALASAALCYHCRMEPAEICQGLSEFRGANRRLMLKGSAGGVTVLDDYAHHPTEVRASLRAVREKFSPRRLWCVFQPHQHSRTRFLLDDFARSFADADVVVVPKIYFVRDSETERHLINSGDLVARIDQLGGTACHLPRLDQIVDYLKGQLAPGDLVITMGAGDIWKIADELICWLGRDRN
jgi:UDP-N-acetylmuramate--alanine ligase